MTNTILTSASSAIQLWNVLPGYQTLQIEGVGPGGNATGYQSSTTGGAGGGGGSYAKRINQLLTGSSIYYRLPAAGSGLDTWFGDLNLLPQSNALGTTPWGVYQIGGVGGYADPFGTSTAWLFTEVVATSTHITYQTQNNGFPTGGLPLNFRLYAHLGTGTGANARRIEAFLGGQTSGCAWAFDLTGGTSSPNSTAVLSGSATNAQAAITTDAWATGASGNGWYLLTGSCTLAAGDTGWQFNFSTDNGTGTAALAATFLGSTSANVYICGAQVNFGTITKPYVVNNNATPMFAMLAKAGTNAVTATAGVGQTGSLGDTIAQGGNGAVQSSGAGGGGGGAGGPSGAGGNASTTTGGTADNAVVAGGTVGNVGNSGTEFDGTHGCGSGAGGLAAATAGTGKAGGSYGGGGGGASKTTAASAGGAGGASLIVLTPKSLLLPHVRLKQYLRR